MEDFNAYTRFLDSLNTYVAKTGNNVLDLLKANCDSYTYNLINQKMELLANELINREYPHITEKIEEMLSTPLNETTEKYEDYVIVNKRYIKEIDVRLNEREIQIDKKKSKGIFKNGQLNGLGKINYIDGDSWEGSFKNGQLNGWGKVVNSDGEVCEGIYKNDELNGQGQIKFSNGESEGEFQNNKLNGCGKVVFKDGEIREGEFQNNKLNGQGKIIFPDGEIQEGFFQNDRLNGEGKVSSKEAIKEGIFEREYLKLGKMIWKEKIYEGEFENDYLYGWGKITFPNGDIWEGNFKRDVLHGLGKRIVNGSIEEGMFENGVLK